MGTVIDVSLRLLSVAFVIIYFWWMGVLWLLSVAVICQTSHISTASSPKNFETSTNSTTPAQRINITVTLHEKDNCTEEIKLREKRGTILQDNNLEKRGGQKLKFSSWAGKRADEIVEDKRAKFSSWGGKRFDEDYLNNIYEDNNDLKRAKFSSWGGKRDFMEDQSDKRAKFSSWAGKRDIGITEEDKRSKFNSWAGKRAPDGDKRAKFSSWAGKRGKFNSWAGKRSDLNIHSGEEQGIYPWDEGPENEQTGEYLSEEKRSKFSSWAGKRSPSYVESSWNKVNPESRLKYYTSKMEEESGSENIMKLWQDLMSRKRARFSSWAGKRSDESISDMESLERLLEPQDEDKRAKFSSWAGKRDAIEGMEKRKFSSWGGKRDGAVVKRSAWSSYKRKPVFSSWGGKRNEHSIQARSVGQRSLVFKGRPWGSLMRPVRKQPEFYAWGGKRSV